VQQRVRGGGRRLGDKTVSRRQDGANRDLVRVSGPVANFIPHLSSTAG
jgi:hypothetical protein